MDQKKLKEILDLHSKWLKDPSTGERADLSGANLRRLKLKDADLRGANLSGTHLGGANLRRADLRGAVLSGANLREADLRGTDLSGAFLSGAKFTVELRESKNLASLVVDRHYDPSQFSMLCLNSDFLSGQKTVVNS